jgi:hypothetical protein
LIFTVLTVGLWLTVWALLSMNRPWNCSKCGSRTYASWWTAPNYTLAILVAIILSAVDMFAIIFR